MNYNIDTHRDTPIYKQVAEAILRGIKSGDLSAGTKLPTVRELADEISISQGTIKHAYDYLENLGAIEMTQGKGTFVLGQEELDAGSRKDRAMAAIDELFCELESLGFTPREMEIYINLKLRGLEEKYDMVKVAVIDCNPETLQLLESQLSQITYAQVAIFSLSQLPEIADKLNEDYDIILTTSSHYSEVEPFIRDNKVFGMLALMPSTETIIELAQLPLRSEVGIVCASDNFAGVVRKNCSSMDEWSESLPAFLLGGGSNGNRAGLADFLKDKTAIIVPKRYEFFSASSEKSALQDFETVGGTLVRYDYKIDRGSFLYVEGLIKKVINKKRSV